MKHFILLWFLTLGMVGYTATEATVTKVERGIVTMRTDEDIYTMPEDEAWRVGDKAEVIIKDDEVIFARYGGRK